MKKLLITLSTLLCHPTATLPAAPLTAIQELRFDAAQGKANASGGVTFANLRARSAQSGLDDYIEAVYAVNGTTGALTMADARVLPGVGLLEPTRNFLAKNVAAQVYMYRTASQPQQYSMDTQYTLATGSGPYYMDLAAGQCLTLHFAYPSPAGTVVLTGPGGGQVGEYAYSAETAGNFLVLSAIPILQSGTHRLDFVPKSGTSGNIRFRFLNENSRTLVNGASGSTVSATLRPYSRDYAKLKVRLLANQTAQLSTTSFNGALMVCNSRGAVDGVGTPGVQGGAIVFTATRDDDFYVFFEAGDSKRSSATSVNFTLNIVGSLSFSNFAAAYDVSPLQQEPTQDADGDGVSNLVEYALGTNPANASARPEIAVTTQNGQLKMTYAVPSYTSGITVVPEFSTGMNGGWQPISPTDTGSTAVSTRFEAFSSGASPGRFLRIRVDQQ